MLNNREKKELRAAAKSTKLRKDFARVKTASNRSSDQSVDLDQLVRFLSDASRAFPGLSLPRPFVPYSRVLL